MHILLITNPITMSCLRQITAIFLLCCTLWSCGDDDTNNFSLPPSTVSFASPSGKSAEGADVQRVAVRLNQPQEGATVINFLVEGSAVVGPSRYQVADVAMLTESPLVIEAGETEAFIEFQALEDQLFEPDAEDLTLTLTGVLKGNALLASQTIYRHLVEENDYELTLSWEASDSVELILLVDQPNSVSVASAQQSRAEKLLLTDVIPQRDYQLRVWYYKGQEDVPYTLTYRAVGTGDEVLMHGIFSRDEASADFDATTGAALHNFRLSQAGSGLIIR